MDIKQLVWSTSAVSISCAGAAGGSAGISDAGRSSGLQDRGAYPGTPTHDFKLLNLFYFQKLHLE